MPMRDPKKYPRLEGYLALSDAAKMLKKSRQAIYVQVRRRNIPVQRIGRQLVIEKSHLANLYVRKSK